MRSQLDGDRRVKASALVSVIMSVVGIGQGTASEHAAVDEAHHFCSVMFAWHVLRDQGFALHFIACDLGICDSRK